MPEKILLKKYSNRRLYDTNQSEYVTLKQVADLVREGHRVEVIDAKTKEDVTAFTLTQIVLEEAKGKNILLPVPLLHLVIQYGENMLAEFFDKYLEQTIKGYLSYKSSVDDHFKKWLEMGQGVSNMAEKSLKDFTNLQSMFNPFFSSNGGDKKEEKE